MLLGVTELWGKFDLFPSGSVAPGKSPLPVPASPVINKYLLLGVMMGVECLAQMTCGLCLLLL